MDASRISLPGIIEAITGFLPPNEIACTVRLVSKALSATFRAFVIVRLSQPVPAHSFAWKWACRSSMSSFPLSQRHELLFLTAASGCLPNLEIAAASAGIVFQAKQQQTKGVGSSRISTALEAAAAAGRLEICEWLRDRGCPWAGSLAAAAGVGQVATCEWLLSSGCPCDRAAVYAAARGGHVGLMEALLLQRGSGSPPSPPFDALRVSGLLAAAAEGFDLATLQRLHTDLMGPGLPSPALHDAAAPQGQDPPAVAAAALQRELSPLPQQLLAMDKASILLAAVSSPTTDWREKVEWLEATLGCGAAAGRRGASGAAAACTKAALRPDALERVTWLHARGYPLSAAVVNAAAAAGNLPLLEYLLAQGLQPSDAASKAAAAGHLAVLQALHARSCIVPLGAMEAAAEGGHLAVVAWVLASIDSKISRISQIAIPGSTILGAARSGNAVLMSWLLEHRRRWKNLGGLPLFRNAVAGGCGEVLRLLAARADCSMEDNGDPYYIAAVNGDLATLRCLRELGCPWGAPGEVFGVCVADGDCPLPVLDWLLQEGCPVGCWEAALAAAARRTGPGREKVRAWLQHEAAQQRALAVVEAK